jgi:two-component system sensor histidine kinase/response regulator
VILRVWLEDTTAVFQVEDTGIGISDHQRPLLFQKFQQLDTSYHRQYEGTGLGLALTKQLVELHGGTIKVESKVDVGSIFTVRVPRQTLTPTAAIVPPAAIPNLFDPPQGRIVLIEDHEECATLICDILTTAGYQVVWMIEGSSAIKQIEILQPLVVITDIQLPDMNGYEVMRYLRQSPENPNLKILALTAKAMAEDQALCLAAGADDYLAKPVQPDLLLDKITLLTATLATPTSQAAITEE